MTASGRQLELVGARVGAGSAPPLDRDLLDVEVRRLDAARLVAIGRVEVALVELRRLLGMTPTEPLRLRDSLERLIAAMATAPPGVASLTPGARSDVREADARVALADARIEQARREGRTDISVFGSYMRMDNGFPQLGVGADGSLEPIRGRFHTLVLGAAIELPVVNRSQGMRAAAEAEARAARARREAVALGVRNEIAAAVVLAAHARAGLDVYATSVRPTARRTLDIFARPTSSAHSA